MALSVRAHVVRLGLTPRLAAITEPSQPIPAAAPPVEDPVRDKVIEIVAEKTGYPKDMLDLEWIWISTWKPTSASTPSSQAGVPSMR